MKLNASKRLAATALDDREGQSIKNLLDEMVDTMKLIQEESEGLDREQRQDCRINLESRLDAIGRTVSRHCRSDDFSRDDLEAKVSEDDAFGSVTIQAPSGRLDIAFELHADEGAVRVSPEGGKTSTCKVYADKPSSLRTCYEQTLNAINAVCASA